MEKVTRAQLKKVRELLREKTARDESGLFVAEGIKIISDILTKGYPLESLLVSGDFAGDPANRSLLETAETRSIPVAVAANKDFEKASSLKSSQGILAVIKKPATSSLAVKAGLVVLCDGIQDPGNLGTMIRTSAAFKADAVLLTGESVDIYNPKVVRSSSGMILDIPVHVCDISGIEQLKEKGYHLLASKVEGRASECVSDIKKFTTPLIIVFGSEGKGISANILEMADGFFHIPIDERVESLNVTAAAAVALFVLSGNKQ